MRNRFRSYLLRRLLGLKLDTDVAIVSIIDNEPIITHGTWLPKQRWPVTSWNPGGWVH